MTDSVGYSSDSPISDPGQDRFKRYPFAQQIAKIIVDRIDPSSIVIGIHGPWGDGKSSVLNFIDQELQGSSDIAIMHYNPWRFGNEEQLLLHFFADLANVLGKSITTRREEIGKLFSRYLRPVISAATHEEVGQGIANLFGAADLEELRKRVAEILQEAGKRVIIMIDDLDRLEKDEINAIFRLVKLTANFQNTAYILAFDETMVTAALADRYGSSAQSFLEKIVQVPLHLPTAGTVRLQRFWEDETARVLESIGVTISDYQKHDLLWHFQNCCQIRLHTPRQVKLYGNALSFALPLLRGEVDIVDVMLMEAMKIFYPQLYRIVRENPEIIFLADSRRSTIPNPNRDNRIRASIEPGFKVLVPEEEKAAIRLLVALFPWLGKLYKETSFRQIGNVQQRVNDRIYYDRYFGYAVPDGDLSDSTVSLLIQRAEEGVMTDEELQETVVRLIESYDPRSLIEKLAIRRDLIPSTSSQRLAKILALLGSRFTSSDRGNIGPSTQSRAALLVDWLLLNIPSQERFTVALDIIGEIASLSFAVEVYDWLQRAECVPVSNDEFSDDQRVHLGRVLVERISTEAMGAPIFTRIEPSYRMLNLWAAFRGKDEVSEYLTSHLTASPALAPQLLQIYLPRVWTSGASAPEYGDFS